MPCLVFESFFCFLPWPSWSLLPDGNPLPSPPEDLCESWERDRVGVRPFPFPFCRSSLRDRVRCGAECPSDCRRSACGCSKGLWYDVTSFSTVQRVWRTVKKSCGVCVSAAGVGAQQHPRKKCVPCEGVVSSHVNVPVVHFKDDTLVQQIVL